MYSLTVGRWTSHAHDSQTAPTYSTHLPHHHGQTPTSDDQRRNNITTYSILCNITPSFGNKHPLLLKHIHIFIVSCFAVREKQKKASKKQRSNTIKNTEQPNFGFACRTTHTKYSTLLKYGTVVIEKGCIILCRGRGGASESMPVLPATTAVGWTEQHVVVETKKYDDACVLQPAAESLTGEPSITIDIGARKRYL